jgi:hypothetical protein
VVNAYFRMGNDAGGFRIWWRKLTGSEETLDNAHLIRMAGRLSRRLRAWAAQNDIPIRDCRVGEPKHEIGEEFLRNTTVQEGLFLILVSRAPAPVWDIHPNRRITRKKPATYVNHYSFHIQDRDWGHITIKISGHPPFPAQVILNGHEYMDRQARKNGILFRRDGNCFTHISDLAARGATGIFRRQSERRMPLGESRSDSETGHTLMFSRVLAVVSPVAGQL